MANRNGTRYAAVCGLIALALVTSTAARAGDGCSQQAGIATSCETTAAPGSFETYVFQLNRNNGGIMNPGDYCLSHRLDQCYPRSAGDIPATVSPQFVADARHDVQIANLSVSVERPVRHWLDTEAQ